MGAADPKSLKIGRYGAPGWIFCVFDGFWVESKNQCFLMSLWGVKKSIKIGPWSARGRKVSSEGAASSRRVAGGVDFGPSSRD